MRVIPLVDGGFFTDGMIECGYKYTMGENRMEKKTIGKFISALRRANGMTQKELGERLYVSDKTVSRWECDECTPELSLIPLIAEIFDITTDELLRGERNKTQNEEQSEKQKEKSEKQFKLMLHNSKKKYGNLSLISIGITMVGLIVAVICNIGFNRGLLGFCLGSIFFIAGVICQICFTVNSRFLIDEDESDYIEILKKANTDSTMKCIKIMFFVAMVWAFCLPLAVIPPHGWGLTFTSWLLYGALFGLIGFIVLFLIYKLFVLKLLSKNEIILLSNTQNRKISLDAILLKRILSVFIIVLAVLLIITYVFNVVIDAQGFIKKDTFDNYDDFISYMQNGYDKWFDEWRGELPKDEVDSAYTNFKEWNEINGIAYYYYPKLYQKIDIQDYENSAVKITVVTKEAYNNGHDTLNTINICLTALYIINFIGCITWYCVGIYKKRI